MNEEYPTSYLDHFQNPRHVGVLDPCTHRAVCDANHPGCHDQLELTLNVTDKIVSEIRFRGRLCSGSLAAASLLCTLANKQPVEFAQSLTFDSIKQVWGVVPAGKEHSIALAIKTLQLALSNPSIRN